MATEAAVTGRWVRLLLLLCTLVGLTAMHTLGHGGHAPADQDTGHGIAHHPAPVEPATPAGLAAMADLPAIAGMAVHPGLAGMAPDCAGDGCAVRALPLGHLGGDPSGWSVCLAVLGAFAVALLAAVLLRARSHTAGPTVDGPFRVASGSRAPPTRPYGLRLAAASVLRR
ncbi:hypothetical protein ACGFI9_07490 [Micromonospora sp. NPDC048930]|uniref:hypothetical protein n=1 Tax=Micromonospora sp. NPDC048930 TaxID=3364261 RepID=UPI00372163EE